MTDKSHRSTDQEQILLILLAIGGAGYAVMNWNTLWPQADTWLHHKYPQLATFLDHVAAFSTPRLVTLAAGVILLALAGGWPWLQRQHATARAIPATSR